METGDIRKLSMSVDKKDWIPGLTEKSLRVGRENRRKTKGTVKKKKRLTVQSQKNIQTEITELQLCDELYFMPRQNSHHEFHHLSSKM